MDRRKREKGGERKRGQACRVVGELDEELRRRRHWKRFGKLKRRLRLYERGRDRDKYLKIQMPYVNYNNSRFSINSGNVRPQLQWRKPFL